jgi:hypothetical protein
MASLASRRADPSRRRAGAIEGVFMDVGTLRIRGRAARVDTPFRFSAEPNCIMVVQNFASVVGGVRAECRGIGDSCVYVSVGPASVGAVGGAGLGRAGEWLIHCAVDYRLNLGITFGVPRAYLPPGTTQTIGPFDYTQTFAAAEPQPFASRLGEAGWSVEVAIDRQYEPLELLRVDHQGKVAGRLLVPNDGTPHVFSGDGDWRIVKPPRGTANATMKFFCAS